MYVEISTTKILLIVFYSKLRQYEGNQAKILSFISIKDIYDKNIITKEVFRISTDFVEYYISDPRTVTLVD